MTLREPISQVREGLKELNADSVLPNKAIWSKIVTMSSLIMQRESDSLRIGHIQDIYQPLKCVRVEEAPSVDPCCGIKSKRRVYRTIIELPEMYSDSAGVIIKDILSVDNSKSITLVTADFIRRQLEDTNSKYDKSVYCFYSDKHLYFTEPIQRVNITGFFVYDIAYDSLCNCNGEAPCFPFLDRKWMIPKKCEDQIITAVIDSIVNKSLFEKKAQDVNINKNPNT